MPRENKKRGRRAETQKRKHDEPDEQDRDVSLSKRRKMLDDQLKGPVIGVGELDNVELEDGERYPVAADERPFYGMLDEQEHEYFKRADGMLEVNQFVDSEERSMFLESVYKEAEGKELKMACSQSCSRLLERLILFSPPKQLKHLFQQFSGQFLHLVQHQFASHCCETLFIKSAFVVTRELIAQPLPLASQEPGVDSIVTMEKLFLNAIDELSGNLGYLVTDRFASHAFRVLLVVLSGQPLDTAAQKSLHRSRKKENVGAEKTSELSLDERTVPDSFTIALEKLMADSVAGLDTHYLRALATHQTGNPVLQLLVQLELTQFGKQKAKDERSIIRRLLPDELIVEGTDSASFINGLLYDPVGSRLLETIVVHAPGKMFKTLFKQLFKDRMGSLARNEIAGYVVMKILERLSAEDLKVALDQILPQIPGLALRGRTAVIRTIVERCHARNVDTVRIRDAIFTCWHEEDGKTFSVQQMLELSPTISKDSKPGHPSDPQPKHRLSEPATFTGTGSEGPVDSGTSTILVSSNKRPPLYHSNSAPIEPTNTSVVLHRSLLAQTMLSVPGPLSDLLFTSISDLPSSVCLHLARTSTLSPVLQSSLTAPHAPLIFRRKLITRFYSHIGALSLDPFGSRLVDAIWAGTLGMAFVRERIAEELAENEATLRGSLHGRKVWRNWRMDLYRRRRGEWVKMVRDTAGNDGFLSFPDGIGGTGGVAGSTRTSSRAASRPSAGSARSISSARSFGSARSLGSAGGERRKTKLDLARERHAAKKGGGGGGGGGVAGSSPPGGGEGGSGASTTASMRKGKERAV